MLSCNDIAPADSFGVRVPAELLSVLVILAIVFRRSLELLGVLTPEGCNPVTKSNSNG